MPLEDNTDFGILMFFSHFSALIHALKYLVRVWITSDKFAQITFLLHLLRNSYIDYKTADKDYTVAYGDNI